MGTSPDERRTNIARRDDTTGCSGHGEARRVRQIFGSADEVVTGTTVWRSREAPFGWTFAGVVVRLDSELPLVHEAQLIVITTDGTVEPFASLDSDAGDFALDATNLEVVDPDIPVSFEALRERLGRDVALASEPVPDPFANLFTRGVPILGVPASLGFASALVQITVAGSCRACDHDRHFPARCRKGDNCPLHL
jgi:hypothetical protein